MVYSGWEPRHPALFQDEYDPRVGGSTYPEGKVVWNIFLWTLQRVTTRTAVVADTPFDHDWKRAMFHDAAASITIPMVEVALHGEPAVLLDRARRRAASGNVHQLKAEFSVNPHRYFAGEYQTVLPEHRVVHVDTTDLDDADPAEIAQEIRQLLP